MHLLGCIGEIAVAEYLGLQEHVFSNKFAVRGSADLPGNIEVKTRSKHGYDLLVQFSDDPSKIFVLATYEEGLTVRLIGWIDGKLAMQKGTIRELVRGRKCFVVPWQKLNPINTLPSFLSGDFPVFSDQDTGCMQINEKFDYSALLSDIFIRLELKNGDTLKYTFLENSSQCLLEKG